jgi:hypothetical protein
MTTIKKLLRPLSGLLFVSALVALVMLLTFDSWYHFQPTAHHQKTGAFALMLVGASFICLQLNASTGRTEMLKGVFLGLAFVLWGGEQFLPPGSFVTVVDSTVITIFVADLGWVIQGRLRRKAGHNAVL